MKILERDRPMEERRWRVNLEWAAVLVFAALVAWARGGP